MKKVITSLVAIIMSMSFAACSDSSDNNSTATSSQTTTASETTTTTTTSSEETTTTTVTTTAEITAAETSSVTETNDMEFLGDYSTDDGTYVKAYSNGSNSIQFNVSLPNDTADNNMQRFETTSSGICDGMVGEYGAPNYIDWWVFCDNKVVFATKSEKQADGTYSFSGVSCADSKYQAAIDDFKNKYVK
jgi:hypothetical protein